MNLFTVTAPLTITCPDGSKKLIIEKFPHPKGLLYFEAFWHVNGVETSVHLISGELSGDGPWKIGNQVISVTGCEGSDPEMAIQLSEWQSFLSVPGQDYPNDAEIRYFAKKLGANIL